jgi:hypothetical protein
MHVITGMIVTALLRRHARRREGHGLPPLRTGPIRVAHALPGRVRFRIPSLVGDAPRCRDLAERLDLIAGVHEAAAEPVTGSIVVRHDPARLPPDLILAAIARLLDLETQLRRPAVPLVTREIRLAAAAANRAVLEQTGGLLDLRAAVMLALGAFGVHRLLSDGARAMPAGLTLVWWATHGLAGRSRDAVQ